MTSRQSCKSISEKTVSRPTYLQGIFFNRKDFCSFLDLEHKKFKHAGKKVDSFVRESKQEYVEGRKKMT